MRLSLLWENNTVGSLEGISAKPAMEDGRAYLANSLGQVFCIALADGEIIWQFRASSVVYADVITVNDYVIVSCTNGFVYALDKKDGRVIWNCLTSGGISNAPAVQDGLIYAGTGGKISCIDSRDGSERWTYAAEKRIIRGPAISRNHLVFSCGDVSGDDIYCVDVKSRQVVWQRETFRCYTGSPVISKVDNEQNEKVFTGGFHEIQCTDLITGHVDWSHYSGDEICVNVCIWLFGIIFGTNFEGQVYSLDKRTGDLQWTASAEGSIVSPQVIADSCVIVPCGSDLYCFDVRRGRLEWKREFQPVFSRCHSVDNYLLLASRYKDVYCYEMIPDEPGN